MSESQGNMHKQPVTHAQFPTLLTMECDFGKSSDEESTMLPLETPCRAKHREIKQGGDGHTNVPQTMCFPSMSWQNAGKEGLLWKLAKAEGYKSC